MLSSKKDLLLRITFLLTGCGVAMGALAAAQSVAPAPGAGIEPPDVASNPADTPLQEDLNSAALPKDGLPAEEPISGGVKETPDYISELYRMQWRGGDPLDVFVVRPKGVSRPQVVIYLYSFPVDPDRFRNDAFCKEVTRRGIAAIGFNPAMTAERYHDVPMRQWFVSELHDSMMKTVHDVQMIVNYTQSRPDLDGSRIGIFGQGAGATIAGLAATADPRIRVIELLDPWGDWSAWMAESKLIPDEERPGFLTSQFLKPLEPLDPLHWMASLSDRSLKLDDATYETATPAAAKTRIDASLPPNAVLMRYPTRDDFQKNALDDGKLIAWIGEQLLALPAGNADGATVSSTQTAGPPAGAAADSRGPGHF